MRTWIRSAFAFTCGCCGERFPAGAVLQRLTLPMLKHPNDRCVTCATEPMPAIVPVQLAAKPLALTHIDVDGLERPGPGPAPMTSIAQEIQKFVKAAPPPRPDYKSKASGE